MGLLGKITNLLLKRGESHDTAPRVALLVDGDNAAAARYGAVSQKAREFGAVTLKQIYADWTDTRMHPWCEVSRIYGVAREQQDNIKGKNSTDIAMVVGAMDLISRKSMDVLCIVSSDGDFTSLAAHAKKRGLTVIGFGRKNTPAPLRRLCDHFFDYDALAGEASAKPARSPYRRFTSKAPVVKRKPIGSTGAQPKKIAPRSAPAPKISAKTEDVIRQAFERASKDGRAHLATLGSTVRRIDPEAAGSKGYYGYIKLQDLLERLYNTYQIEIDTSQSVPRKFVKLRPKSTVTKPRTAVRKPATRATTPAKPTAESQTSDAVRKKVTPKVTTPSKPVPPSKPAPPAKPTAAPQIDSAVRKIVEQAFNKAAKDGDRATLAGVGSAIRKLDPDGDRDSYYGFPKLYNLFEQLPEMFKIETDTSRKTPVKYVVRK